MARTPVSVLPIVCWALMFSLLAVEHTVNGSDTPTTPSQIKIFHAVAAQPETSILATLASEEDAILAAQSDLVVVTSSGNSTTTALADNLDLTKHYKLIGDNHVLYKADAWEVVREAALNGTVWARLKSTNMSFACVIVAETAEAWTESMMIEIVDRMDSFCGPQDAIVLGFTRILADSLSAYLQGQASIKGKYVPRIMAETSALAKQRLVATDAASTSAAATAAQRLFIHSPDTACLEDASAKTTDDAVVAVTMSLCIGSNCAACQLPSPSNSTTSTTAPSTTQHHSSSGKHGLIVLLSCGTFLLGCGLVFYIFFRKQFFLPTDSASKQEKEITTNLAYVLRV